MNHHFSNCGKLQTTVTDIYTPKGEWIHRTYKLELEKLSVSDLRYTSKFPIPIGMKLFINVIFQREKVRFLIEVFENQRVGNGKYSVGCKILFENSEQDLGVASNYLYKSHYGSGIH